MTDQQQPDAKVPASEVAFAGGNVIAMILTALGGLWVWLAAAAAVGAVALAASKRRSKRADRSAVTRSGRTIGSRTGGRVFGRSGSPRSGRRTASAARMGAGRRRTASRTGSGRTGILGRRRGGRTGTAASGRGGRTAGAQRSGMSRLMPWRRRTAGAGGSNGRASGRMGRPARSTGRRLSKPSTWLNGAARSGRSRRSGKRGAWKPPVRADVINRKPAATTTPKAPASKPSGKPIPKPTIKKTTADPKPRRDTPPTTGRKGTIMGKFGKKWRENAEEMASRAAGYDPEKMPDYLSDLKDLTEAFQSESQAIGRVAAVSEAQLPVDPQLADYLRKNQALLRKVSEDMRDVVGYFLRKHEADMARHAAPRANEQKWNV